MSSAASPSALSSAGPVQRSMASAVPTSAAAAAASSSSSSSSSSSPSTSVSSSGRRPDHPPFRYAHPLIFLNACINMPALGLAAYYGRLSPLAIMQPLVSLVYFVFREQWVVQAVWYTAAATHLAETLWVAASGVLDDKGVVDRWHRVGWVVQTFLVGWGGIGLLRQLPDVKRDGSKG